MENVLLKIIDDIKHLQKKADNEHLFESNYGAYQECILVVQKYLTEEKKSKNESK
jgi:hypothetical protein